MRRPLLLASAACALGGLLVLLAAGRTWGEVTARTSGAARQHVTVTGHAVASALPALGLALLALAVAMLAGSGLVRRLAGVIVVAVGAATVAVAVRARGDVGKTLASRLFASQQHTVGGSRAAWWVLAAIGGLVALGAGAVVAVRSARWTGLGARYDAPVAAAQKPPADAWDAIDRGDDPTE